LLITVTVIHAVWSSGLLVMTIDSCLDKIDISNDIESQLFQCFRKSPTLHAGML